MKHYCLKSAGLASLRPVDSENSPYYLKAILAFHSSAPWTIRCRQHLLHILDQWEETKCKQRMREKLWSAPQLIQGMITLLLCSHIWNACNTPPEFQSTLELHCVQEQTTNVKVPWSSYKLHFGKKLCLYPLTSASASWSKLFSKWAKTPCEVHKKWSRDRPRLSLYSNRAAYTH